MASGLLPRNCPAVAVFVAALRLAAIAAVAILAYQGKVPTAAAAFGQAIQQVAGAVAAVQDLALFGKLLMVHQETIPGRILPVVINDREIRHIAIDDVVGIRRSRRAPPGLAIPVKPVAVRRCRPAWRSSSVKARLLGR